MSDVALLLLQISTSAVPSPSAAEALLHPVPRSGCHPSENEITVCAKDPDTYRLPKGDATAESLSLPKAEWRVFGNAKMNIHGEQRTLPQGATAPAAMVTLKWPF